MSVVFFRLIASSMPTVHEQVDDGTKQKQHKWEGPEDVGLMLFPQEEQRDGGEEAEAHHPWDAESLRALSSLRCGLHFECSFQACARLRRRAFVTTETELRLIAAAAMTGLSSRPNTGYSTPAAIGTPAAL